MTGRPHLVVVDPAVRTAETECFNRMALTAPLPVTYHLPCMYGLESLQAEDMRAVRGLIILGSASSVTERLPWQVALETWLRPHLEAGLPTLGLCYGHQMLAHMLGGRVAYMTPERTKLKGFRRVKVAATAAWPAGEGELVVSHNEAVVEAPRDMTVLATSDAVAIDGLAHRTLPIWTLQPHPEATPEFLSHHGIPAPARPAEALAFGFSLVDAFLAYAARGQG